MAAKITGGINIAMIEMTDPAAIKPPAPRPTGLLGHELDAQSQSKTGLFGALPLSVGPRWQLPRYSRHLGAVLAE
ncbi:hypothetical protein [Mesorhizobium ventifaucium]|uniref:Uncharacterized protein n=1 Tax=Mesorhizobium ventifaucium TaxID=666020 RepID=A0ABM9DE02_9HYPH|nr:hypothetical protein [Mesorhizobium ventifaucium]CAH2394510.1 hypothetical protein MES4922_100099 [Mesorhizobium ventifaucium]